MKKVSFLKRIAKFFNILATESYATFRYVLPCAIAWVWKKYVSNEIKTIEIPSKKTQKSAFLNIHGKLNTVGIVSAVLLCHGDYGHPYTMLHLAEIAKKEGLAVFSIYIPKVNEDQQFDIYNEFLKNAIDTIENFIRKENGIFSGVLGAGHSKGAILLAQRQFVNLDPRIKSTCAIAGGLNIQENKKSSHRVLTKIVKNIYEGIVNHPQKTIIQIIPKDDWNSSRESMAVRPYDHCYEVPGMHLSALYKNETRKYFSRFLREFSQ